jgi:hypothetical protein
MVAASAGLVAAVCCAYHIHIVMTKVVAMVAV